MSNEISHFISDIGLHATKWPHDVPIRDGKMTKNFTLGEWLDSMRFADADEKKKYIDNFIPMHENLPMVAQTVRDFTGKPVLLGSSFRSKRWEVLKGRSGDGDHPNGRAVDLNGNSVYEMVHNAFLTKNELYQELKDLGVNTFGFYSWGVHLGIREPKKNGEDYVWYNQEETKKKSGDVDSIWYLLYFTLFYLFHKPLFRLLKRIFKF